MLKRFATWLVTGPPAFFLAWAIDVVVLLAKLRAVRARERAHRTPWLSSARR